MNNPDEKTACNEVCLYMKNVKEGLRINTKV
jgi:hypothetical protein